MFRSGLKFRRTTVMTVGLVSFLLGIGFARANVIVSQELLICSFLLFLVTILRLKTAAVLSVVLLGFTFGWWRGQIFLEQIQPLQQLSGQHIIATVQADSDSVYNDRRELIFDASHLHVSDPEDMVLPGRLSVSGFGEPAIYKGDIVRLEGKAYPSRGSRQLRISFAELQVLGRTASPVDGLRRKFAAGMETSLPEPQASFGLGLLIGQRNTLPKSVNEALSVVGLTHIVAVSGYNLTIILRSVRRFLKGHSKFQTTILSSVLMGLFLLMTGFSASIVRAALVSSLSLAAWYYGRQIRPVLLLALVAAVTAGWNPFYLWSDIGWYLSFLAFFGVLIVAPLLGKRLFGDTEPKPLAAVLTESFCALLMTWPFVLFIFSQASSVALIANMLVVPLVPLAMLFALVAGLGGMLLPIMSGILALPARVLLTFILDVAELLSRIPNVLLQRRLQLAGMLFLYVCIIVFVLALKRATERKHAILDSQTSGD